MFPTVLCDEIVECSVSVLCCVVSTNVPGGTGGTGQKRMVAEL